LDLLAAAALKANNPYVHLDGGRAFHTATLALVGRCGIMMHV
jgi:hypothetical protein